MLPLDKWVEVQHIESKDESDRILIGGARRVGRVGESSQGFRLGLFLGRVYLLNGNGRILDAFEHPDLSLQGSRAFTKDEVTGDFYWIHDGSRHVYRIELKDDNLSGRNVIEDFGENPTDTSYRVPPGDNSMGFCHDNILYSYAFFDNRGKALYLSTNNEISLLPIKKDNIAPGTRDVDVFDPAQMNLNLNAAQAPRGVSPDGTKIWGGIRKRTDRNLTVSDLDGSNTANYPIPANPVDGIAVYSFGEAYNDWVFAMLAKQGDRTSIIIFDINEVRQSILVKDVEDNRLLPAQGDEVPIANSALRTATFVYLPGESGNEGYKTEVKIVDIETQGAIQSVDEEGRVTAIIEGERNAIGTIRKPPEILMKTGELNFTHRGTDYQLTEMARSAENKDLWDASFRITSG